jgi:hypothetical protein
MFLRKAIGMMKIRRAGRATRSHSYHGSAGSRPLSSGASGL